MRCLVRAWSWAYHHSLAFVVIAAAAWAVVVYLFVDNLIIALLCGAVFGGVITASLPEPPVR